MYNDEHNLYHYTYRKDGSETDVHPAPQAAPEQDHNNGPQQPVQEMKPVKKNRIGMKLTAMALCCALLGGAVGGGIVWGVGNHSGETSVNVSGRTVSQVSLKTVDGQTEMSDAEIYAANVNSVVSINVTGTSGYNFFGQPVQSASSGSGFVLTSDGYIVTNYHVVKDAQTVKVTMYNGDEYDAQYVGGDEDYDIAVIKIEATGLPAVTLGNSEELNVGDHVLAIGNPLGDLTFSMSGGMVSSVNRTINVDGTPFNMIQVTAAINPGNSGGALLNMAGELIGINEAKTSSSGSGGSVDNIGFAIPIDKAEDSLKELMNLPTREKVDPSEASYLGIEGETITQDITQLYGIPTGVGVVAVEQGSPAEKAGIQQGDVITQFDGRAVANQQQLSDTLQYYKAGETVDVTLQRADNGKYAGQTVSVTLGSAKDMPQESGASSTAESSDT